MTKTLSNAQSVATQEIKRRLDSGDLGNYEGVLFKDAFRSGCQSSAESAPHYHLGVVASQQSELVGLIDKLGVFKSTHFDQLTYWSGQWRNCNIIMLATGDGLAASRLGTIDMILRFMPERIVSIGFATPLTDRLPPGALLAPQRLIQENGESLPLFDDPTLAETATDQEQPLRVDTPLDATSNFPEQTCEESLVAPTPSAELLEKSRDFLQRFSTGALVSVEKKQGSKSTAREFVVADAVAYDHSAWGVAEACRSHNVPFLTLRAAYDPQGEAKSQEALQVARESKSIAWKLGAFLGATSKRPQTVLDLIDLKTRAIANADKLADAAISLLNICAGK
ncbi:MAG: hypothetical protein Q4G03_07190 [Planctomycetia bacterium]|nr:hypothetical protein [Planctomycetia bacterium]